MPQVEHKARAMVCHVGNTLLLRADSTGVGQLHPRPGPKLVVIGAAACTMTSVPNGHAPVQTCTVGNQEYVLDATGVGDSTGVGGDAAGMGQLSLDKSNCKWVTQPSTLARILECQYGPVVFRIDSTGVGEGSARTASRR